MTCNVTFYYFRIHIFVSCGVTFSAVEVNCFLEQNTTRQFRFVCCNWYYEDSEGVCVREYDVRRSSERSYVSMCLLVNVERASAYIYIYI